MMTGDLTTWYVAFGVGLVCVFGVVVAVIIMPQLTSAIGEQLLDVHHQLAAIRHDTAAVPAVGAINSDVRALNTALADTTEQPGHRGHEPEPVHRRRAPRAARRRRRPAQRTTRVLSAAPSRGAPVPSCGAIVLTGDRPTYLAWVSLESEHLSTSTEGRSGHHPSAHLAHLHPESGSLT
jgi:hypothetical protein